METALLHSSTDQESMSSYKKARNPKRRSSNNNNQTRSFIPSRTNSIGGNLYYTKSLPKMEMMANGGAFLNPPFPPSSSLPRLNSSPYPLQFHQPPLLPLPVTPSRQFQSLPPTSISGGATRLSPTHKKHNKGIKNQKGTKVVNNNRLGPTPESLPKDLKKFSGPVFPEAPPPSSLPMPKFSLKPKMSCRVEASGSGSGVRVNTAGATGNLCRLLNLR